MLFFLPLPDIADFFGPFLVRALVLVRCPRAGKPLRCLQSAIAADVHQSLDVHRDIPAQISLHRIITVKNGADLNDIGFGQIVALGGRIDACFSKNLLGGWGPIP